ncbi:hypothetical protein HpBT252_11980 [Helicobacter pylori]
MEHIVSIARNNLGEYSVTQHFKENLRDDHLYEKYKKVQEVHGSSPFSF